MRLSRAGRPLLAALLVAASPIGLPAFAAAAQSTIHGIVKTSRGGGGRLSTLTLGFRIAKSEGERTTLDDVVVRLPSNVVLHGARLPACPPRLITPRDGFAACPFGSRVGIGRFVADVPAAGLADLPGRVLVFNGRRGRSLTLHFFADTPPIQVAFSVPLRPVAGRFRYVMRLPFPTELQEVETAAPSRVVVPTGPLLEIKRLDLTLRASWRGFSYVAARSCPASRATPLAGAFGFLGAPLPSLAVGRLACAPAR